MRAMLVTQEGWSPVSSALSLSRHSIIRISLGECDTRKWDSESHNQACSKIHLWTNRILVVYTAACLPSVHTTPPLPVHLLIKLGLQRVFREDVKVHLPVAEQHGRLEHDQGLLQPIATGHHGQVHPQLGRQHGLETPGLFRSPRKRKSRLTITKLNKRRKEKTKSSEWMVGTFQNMNRHNLLYFTKW